MRQCRDDLAHSTRGVFGPRTPCMSANQWTFIWISVLLAVAIVLLAVDALDDMGLCGACRRPARRSLEGALLLGGRTRLRCTHGSVPHGSRGRPCWRCARSRDGSSASSRRHRGGGHRAESHAPDRRGPSRPVPRAAPATTVSPVVDGATFSSCGASRINAPKSDRIAA